MYESINSEVIQSLAWSEKDGLTNIQSSVVSSSLVPNLAYIPTHCGSEREDIEDNTIMLDFNPAYTANSGDLDSQGHLDTVSESSV